MDSLDLYAKIEPLIGFYEEYNDLYSSYLQILKSLHVESILDVGCGNGKLLKILEENGYTAFGIDRSKEMISVATNLGVKASADELSELQEKSYDCVLCVGDVLNYIAKKELKNFFIEIKRVLKVGGYILCDINTLEGFNIADGVMVNEFKDKFLCVEAIFDDEILNTRFTLFERHGKTYKKEATTILQYYHQLEYFKNIRGFSLL